jgi:transposase
LLAWAVPWSARRWAVEGATGLGPTVAQQLVGTGELVVDVPAKLAARARLLGAGSARKTDRTDAASVAVVALHHRRLLRSTNTIESMIAICRDHAANARALAGRADGAGLARRRYGRGGQAVPPRQRLPAPASAP